MEFTKTVVTTHKIAWIQDTYRLCDSTFLEKQGSNPDLNACFKCDAKFQEGDTMALANITDTKNVLFCQTCVAELKASDKEE